MLLIWAVFGIGVASFCEEPEAGLLSAAALHRLRLTYGYCTQSRFSDFQMKTDVRTSM